MSDQPSTREAVAIEDLYLGFKYKKNQTITIGGEHYPIKMDNRMREKDGHSLLLPYFHMDEVHKVPLGNEDPQLPDREESFSDRQHEERCEEAYDEARANRKANDGLRKEVYRLVEAGVLEVVHDPFSRRKISGKASTSMKPSEIAAAMDEADKAAKQAAKKK